MPLVLGWYCEHTEKMFKEKDKYLTHLKKQAKERYEQRKKARFSKSRDEYITEMCKVVKTIPELEQFIRDNWDWFSYNGYYNNVLKWGGNNVKEEFTYPKLISITIAVKKKDEVSNSHYCPKDGVTNWGGNVVMPDGSPAPRNYPGWYGSIRFVIEKSSYGSACFDETCINTGSGSGGRNSKGDSTYQYECFLFESDFPAMTEFYYKNENWKTLGGKDLLEMA